MSSKDLLEELDEKAVPLFTDKKGRVMAHG